MVDGARTVSSTRVPAALAHIIRLRYATRVRREDRSPIEIVLLERLRPVVENLAIGPDRLGRLTSLDTMLMQEGEDWLNEPHVSIQHQRKTHEPRLTPIECLEPRRQGREGPEALPQEEVTLPCEQSRPYPAVA